MAKRSQNPDALKKSRNERFEARITSEMKATLQLAAVRKGLSLTDFVMESARRAAEEVIRDYNVITLTTRDSLAFAEAILNPGTPNANLQSAFARHTTEVVDDK